MLIFTLLAGLFALLFYIYITYFTYPKTTIPGPPSHWLWGNLPELRKAGQERQNAFLWKDWANKYGKIVKAEIPLRANYMITLSDGESIKRVLNDMDSFHAGKGFSDSLSTVAPQSLVILSGDDWKRHRKIVGGAFAPTQLKFAMDVTMERLNTMLSKWDTLNESQSTRNINCHDDFSRFTIDIIGEVAFGYKFNTLTEGNMFSDDLAQIADWVNKLGVIPKQLWPLIPGYHDYLKVVQRMKKLPHDIVQERRNTQDEYKDLLDKLIRSLDGESLVDEEVLNEIMLFFLAGHETTANTLTWVIHMVGDKPEIQERIKAEADEVFQDEITYEKISKLKYTEAVIKETLRIIPTSPVTGRLCVKESELLGHKIIPGMTIILNFFSVHHDPENFENPTVFNPERWLQPNDSYFFPFGAGPKTCVGNKMAMMESKLTMARIFQKYKITHAPNQDFTPVHTVTMGLKDGLFINVDPR